MLGSVTSGPRNLHMSSLSYQVGPRTDGPLSALRMRIR